MIISGSPHTYFGALRQVRSSKLKKKKKKSDSHKVYDLQKTKTRSFVFVCLIFHD